MPIYRITAPNGQTYRIEGPPGASDADVADAVMAQYPESGKAPAPPQERTFIGGAKELFKGLVPGAVGLVESAATGASALLPDQMEKAAREKIASVATSAKEPFKAAAGYEESVPRKLGESIGSTAPFLLAGPLGLAGRAAAVGLGVGAGAGEARTRAETEGATADQRGTATALGVLPGALEAFAPFRILARIPEAATASAVQTIKRILLATGEEAAQEAASGLAQNMIAKGIYKPEQALIEGLGEQAAYGGATGAIVQGLMDLALGRRAKGAAPPPAPPPPPPEEVVPGAKLPEEAPVGKQGALFTPQEMGKKVAQPKQEAAPVAETFPELTARREQLRAQEQTPEVRAELDAITKRLAPQSDAQQGLGLDYQRDYADLFKERNRLRTAPQTPEVKARVTELSEQLASYDEADIGSRQADKAIKEQRLTEQTEQKAADEAAAQKFPGLAGATTAPITQADIDAIGLPLRTSKQWLTDNVVGRSTEEIKALVQRDPKLVSGTGARAGVLKALISPQPAVFEEKPNVPTTTQTNQPQGELDLGGGKPSVGVSSEPAITNVVQPGAGVPAPTGASKAPDGLGLAPAGQPVSKGAKAKGTTAPAVTPSAPTTTPAAPSTTATTTTTAGPKKTPEPAPKITPPKEDKAPPTPKATEPVKSQYERLLDVSNNESIPIAMRKQAEKQMDLMDDPTMNTSKAARKANEEYADRLLTRIDGLKSVAIAEGQPLDALKTEVKNAKGVLGTALRRMVESGKVVLEDAHPSGKRIGGFYDGEKVTLYANGIPSGQSMAVALHEVGAHLGMQKLLGKKQYNAVIDRILDMVAKGDGSTEAKMAQTAYKRIPVSDLERGVGRDEMVAYFIEEMAKSEAAGTLPKIGPMRVMWNQIKTAIVTSINKALGTNFGVKDFSAQDILDIAKSSFVAESKSGVTKGKEVDMASTSQFQKWFGDSKVVDKDGKPLRVYHGTLADFDTFKVSPEGSLGAGIYTTPSAEFAGTYADTSNLSRADAAKDEVSGQKILPVYVSIQNPLIIEKGRGDPMIAALVKLGMAKDKAETLVEKAYDEHGYIRKQVMTRAMAQGYDGIMQYGRDDGELSEVVAFKPTQVKSAIGNRGTYDIDNPKFLFSTSYSAQDVVDSLGPLTPLNERSVKQMVFGMQKEGDPTAGVKFRVATVDSAAAIEEKFSRTFGGAVRDKFGKLNPMGLYRQAQDYSKLLLEYFQNGTLVKDKTTGLYRTVGKGEGAPVDVFPLIYAWGAKTGRTDKEAEQFASRVLEAKRLDEVLKVNPDFPKHLTDRDRALLVAEYNSDPAFAEMSAAMDKPRIALINKMVDVGRLSQETATEWKSVIGYVPFDRIEDFEKKFSTVKKTTGRSPLALTKDPELVGSFERPVGNVFENYLNTMGWMVGQVMNNDARIQTLRGLEDLRFAKFKRGVPGAEGRTAKAYVNGEIMYWELPSRYDVAAFQDLNPPKMAIMRTLGAFSNVLRKSVTLLPPFALKQVTDDVQRAMLTSGVKSPTALLRMTLANFGSLAWAEIRGIQHPIVKEFGALGLTGEYDYEAGKPALSVLKDLGYRERTVAGSKLLGNLLHRLDGITRASDLAVRKAIYDQTMIETNKDQLLAQTRAREFINFRRRGASEIIAIGTATIPFFNAYVQGMDVLYRAASGKDSSSSVGRAQARQLFWSRAGTVIALSTMYAMMSGDDEDYQDMDLRTRNSNWILPGGYKIPVPGELGALFKVIPETVIEYLRRSGTPEEQTALEAIRSSMMYMAEQYIGRTVPIPQAVKPLIEAWTNYSFFTGRELEGIYQKQQDPSMRVTSKTSELAQAISNFSRDVIGVDAVSPIQIDNMLSGYFGSTAALVVMTTDSLLNPSRVDRPLHKYALLSNYMYDPIGTRTLTEFYDEREKVGKANNTLRQLMKTDIARAEAYAESHQMELAMESGINSTLEQLERTRAYRKFLNSPDGAAEMSKADREKELEEIKKMEIEFTRWVREAKTELRKEQR